MQNKPLILLTGSAGHAGRGVADVLKDHFRVRGFDVRASGACNESVVGSVTDPGLCGKAMEGVSAFVTCHMGHNPMGYQPPFDGVDVSIKGTLNLYTAAAEKGVQRAVQISSACILPPGAVGSTAPDHLVRRLDVKYGGIIYALNKTVEEMIASIFYEKYGLVTTALRPAWIVEEQSNRTKYETLETKYSPELIDPSDLGRAVVCCLERETTQLEGYVVGQPEYLDVKRTMEILGWEPLKRFQRLKKAMQ